MKNLNPEIIDRALQLLGERLELAGSRPIRLVVCGGAALIACSLVTRSTTHDVDIVAMVDKNKRLVSPDPLPDKLLAEAGHVRVQNGRALGGEARFFSGLPGRSSLHDRSTWIQ